MTQEMQLQPKDLGEKWHIAVVRYRALGTARINTPPRLGRLGNLWAKGVDASPEVIAATLPMMADQTNPLVHFAGSLTVIATIAATIARPDLFLLILPIALALLLVFLILLPRQIVHKMHSKPLEWEELEAVKGPLNRVRTETDEEEEAGLNPLQPVRKLLNFFQSIRGTRPGRPSDELERLFIAFVQEVVAAQGISEAHQKELRQVIRSMGNVIASIPAQDARDADEIADVLMDAEMLVNRAEREGDKVVAESLLRQADAHVSRASAIQNNRKLAKRIRTLREEMLGQVKMVRSLLPALKGEAIVASDESRFLTVSENVQGIASEASNVVAAREELAQALWSGNEAQNPPQMVQVRGNG
jgi:hypothetical protein